MSGNSSIVNSVLDQLSASGHKKVVYCNDPDTGLKAIIAIHDTTLGPALGGTRMMLEQGVIDKLSFVDIDEKGNVDYVHLEELLKNNERSFVSLMHVPWSGKSYPFCPSPVCKFLHRPL